MSEPERPKCPTCGKPMVWKRVKVGRGSDARWAERYICLDCEPQSEE